MLGPSCSPGASAAAVGAALIAAAPTLLIAGLGLAVAAAGTAVLFPTLLGVVSRNVDESRRGRATSVVTSVSYLGFLVGPVYVGLGADAVGLRGAMVAVAAPAVGLLVLTRRCCTSAAAAPEAWTWKATRRTSDADEPRMGDRPEARR